jgi:hypothetical protein
MRAITHRMARSESAGTRSGTTLTVARICITALAGCSGRVGRIAKALGIDRASAIGSSLTVRQIWHDPVAMNRERSPGRGLVYFARRPRTRAGVFSRA